MISIDVQLHIVWAQWLRCYYHDGSYNGRESWSAGFGPLCVTVWGRRK